MLSLTNGASALSTKRRIATVRYEQRINRRKDSSEIIEESSPELSYLADFFEVCDNPSAWAGNNAGVKGIVALAETLQTVRGTKDISLDKESLEEAEMLLERYHCASASDPEEVLRQRVILTRDILPVLVADSRVMLPAKKRATIIESFYNRLYNAWHDLPDGPNVSPAEVRSDMAEHLTPHLATYDLTNTHQFAQYRQTKDAMRQTKLISPLMNLRRRHRQ